jgi:hypothetical protein
VKWTELSLDIRGKSGPARVALAADEQEFIELSRRLSASARQKVVEVAERLHKP